MRDHPLALRLQHLKFVPFLRYAGPLLPPSPWVLFDSHFVKDLRLLHRQQGVTRGVVQMPLSKFDVQMD